MARQILGVSASTSAIVSVPSGLDASGVPSATTYLRGDGTWATPVGTGGGGGGGTDPNSVQLTGDQTIAGIKTFLSPPVGITKAAVGLGNVDNTSDANKPISAATQTALNAKVSTTGTATVQNLAVSGTVSFVDGSIPQVDVQNLVSDLAAKIGTVANTADVTVSVMYQFKTTNPAAVRPTVPTGAAAIWDLPGNTPPANAAPNDKWLR
jgi:hypothetical protein